MNNISRSRYIALGITVVVILAAILYLQPKKVIPSFSSDQAIMSLAATSASSQRKATLFDTAKEISTPDGFINTDKLSIKDLIGKKVILIDFWTYSCINCQRTTPYLNAWYEKYRNQGLEIIGMHTPEFEFEKDYENVHAAVQQAGIKFPVVMDNDYSTWTAYENRYWPHKYLIDIDGYIIYDHIGEGKYAETEEEIQKALEERRQVLKMREEVSKGVVNPINAGGPDPFQLGSPETYFGALRNNNFGSGFPGATGTQTFVLPEQIEENILYLGGAWQITEEYAENKGVGRVAFKYTAKEVHLVASAPKGGSIRILKDGKPLPDQAGALLIKEDRLYSIIKDEEYGTHMIEIIIDKPGVRLFAFTFG